jgi:hypothetical protein
MPAAKIEGREIEPRRRVDPPDLDPILEGVDQNPAGAVVDQREAVPEAWPQEAV